MLNMTDMVFYHPAINKQINKIFFGFAGFTFIVAWIHVIRRNQTYTFCYRRMEKKREVLCCIGNSKRCHMDDILRLTICSLTDIVNRHHNWKAYYHDTAPSWFGFCGILTEMTATEWFFFSLQYLPFPSYKCSLFAMNIV